MTSALPPGFKLDASPGGLPEGFNLDQPGPTIAKARLDELSKMTLRPSTARAEYEAMGPVKRHFANTIDAGQLMAHGATAGLIDNAAAAVRAPFTDKTYREELEDQREMTNDARARQRGGATLAEIAGAVMGPGFRNTAGLKGFGKAALEGAAYGGASAYANDQDILPAAALGGGLGIGGKVGGDLIGKGTQMLSERFAPVADKAKQRIFKMGQDSGLDAGRIAAEKARHGPDLMAADILQGGASAGRTASNISPVAREMVETAVSGRKAGQNQRVVGALEDAADLPRGSRMTVEDLTKGAMNARKKAIDEAYERARAEGYDLPRGPFDAVLTSPMGRAAYDNAAKSLKNRKATEGISAASELARLDQTQRELGDIADKAFRSGEKDKGSQAKALQRALKDAMDASIAGPEYQAARALRREAGEAEDAIELGADLGRGRAPLDAPVKARDVKPEHRKGLRQGYTAQTADRLLNRGSTEGALTSLSTPMSKEAIDAVFDTRARGVHDALDTEQLFNRTNRDIVGNSTTARQVAEAVGLGAGGAGLSWLTGIGDPMTMGLGGALRLAPKGLQAMRRLSGKQQELAPEIARLLISSPDAIPLERAIQPGRAEQGFDAMRDYLTRLLTRGGVTGFTGGD